MFKNLSNEPIAEVQNKQVEAWKKEDLLKAANILKNAVAAYPGRLEAAIKA